MSKVFDILIIGGGVAGMTAAIYGLRAKKSVAIIEAGAVGGQILATGRIENYPGMAGVSGRELVEKLKEQVINLGGEFIDDRAEGIRGARKDVKTVVLSDGEAKGRTVIIANGSTERKLGVAREEELLGRGVSYCATCDGAFYRGKKVAVNGGGNSAVYSALYLSEIAEKVYLVHRRAEFRAEKGLMERVRETKNIEIVAPGEVVGLVGEEQVERIRVKTGAEVREIEVEGVFVAIGREAKNEAFLSVVELDKDGYIKAGEDCKTSTPGIFCAGDTRAKSVRQLVTATADGAVAATGAVEYLNLLETR